MVFYNDDDSKIEYSFRFNTTRPIADGLDFIDLFDYITYKEQDDLLRRAMPSFQYNYFSTNFIHFMNYIDNIILQKYSNLNSAYIAAGFVPMYYDA